MLAKPLEELDGFLEIHELNAIDWQSLQSHPPKTWKDALDQIAPTFGKVENHKSFWPQRNSVLSKVSEVVFLLEIQGAKKGMNLSYIFYQKLLMAFSIVRIIFKESSTLRESFLKAKFPKISKFRFTPDLFAVMRDTSNFMFQQDDVKACHFKFFHSIVTTLSNLMWNMNIPDYEQVGDEEEDKEMCYIIEALMASRSIGKPQDSLLYGFLDLSFSLQYKQDSKALVGSSHNCPMLFRPLFEQMVDPIKLLSLEVINMILCIRSSYAFLGSSNSDKLIPCTFVYPEEAKAIVQFLGGALVNFDLGRSYVPLGPLDFLTDAVLEFMDSYDYHSVLCLDKLAETVDRTLYSLLDENFLAALETHPKRDAIIFRMQETITLLGKPLYSFPEKWSKAKNNLQTKLIEPSLGEKLFSFEYDKLIDSKLSESYPKSFISVARVAFFNDLIILKDWISNAPSDLPTQKTLKFLKSLEKFFIQYKPSNKYLEFSLFTSVIQNDPIYDEILLKIFNEEKFFENLPELFWDKIEPAIKIRNKNASFFASYYYILQRQNDSADKISNLKTVLEKFVTYVSQNISLEFKNFEQNIMNSTSLTEEELLKAVDRQHSVRDQWEFLLLSIRRAVDSGSEVKDQYLLVIDLLKYPSILFLNNFGIELIQFLGETYDSGTQENKTKLTHLIFDNLIEIYDGIWGESSTQQPVTENEILQIPLLKNYEWLFAFVEEFQECNEDDIDWRIGIKMDPKSRYFALCNFYIVRVFQELHRHNSTISPILSNYSNLTKLKQILNCSVLILKHTIQRYIEAKLSQKKAFSAEKAEATYEDIVHPMIGKGFTNSLLKKMALSLLKAICLMDKNFIQNTTLFLFSQFEAYEDADVRTDSKEASRRLWNAMLFDLLNDIHNEAFLFQRFVQNKVVFLNQVIFDPIVLPRIANWIFNLTLFEPLHPNFKELDEEIKTMLNSVFQSLKNDTLWIKDSKNFVSSKYESNQKIFRESITNLSEALATHKSILPMIKVDSMPVLINFVELLMNRVEMIIEVEDFFVSSRKDRKDKKEQKKKLEPPKSDEYRGENEGDMDLGGFFGDESEDSSQPRAQYDKKPKESNRKSESDEEQFGGFGGLFGDDDGDYVPEKKKSSVELERKKSEPKKKNDLVREAEDFKVIEGLLDGAGEPQEEEKKIDPAKVEAEKEKKKQEEQKRSEEAAARAKQQEEEEREKRAFTYFIIKPMAEVYKFLIEAAMLSSASTFKTFLDKVSPIVRRMKCIGLEMDKICLGFFDLGSRLLEKEFSGDDLHHSLLLLAKFPHLTESQDQSDLYSMLTMKLAVNSLVFSGKGAIEKDKIPLYFERCYYQTLKLLTKKDTMLERIGKSDFDELASSTLTEWGGLVVTYLLSIDQTKSLDEESSKAIEKSFDLSTQIIETTLASHLPLQTQQFLEILLIATSLRSDLEEKLLQSKVFEIILRVYSDSNDSKLQSEIALLIVKLINRKYPWHIVTEMAIKTQFFLRPEKNTFNSKEVAQFIPMLNSTSSKEQLEKLEVSLSKIFTLASQNHEDKEFSISLNLNCREETKRREVLLAQSFCGHDFNESEVLPALFDQSQRLILQTTIKVLLEQFKQRIKLILDGDTKAQGHNLSLLSLLGSLATKYPTVAAYLSSFDIKSELGELLTLFKKFSSPMLLQVATELEAASRVSFLEATLKLFYLVDLTHSPQFIISMLLVNPPLLIRKNDEVYELSHWIQNVVLTSVYSILENQVNTQENVFGDYTSYNIWCFYSQLYLSILENCWKDQWLPRHKRYRKEQMQIQRAFMNLTLRYVEKLDLRTKVSDHHNSRNLFSTYSELITYYQKWYFQEQSVQNHTENYNDMLWMLNERRKEGKQQNEAQNYKESLDQAKKIASIAQASFQKYFDSSSSSNITDLLYEDKNTTNSLLLENLRNKGDLSSQFVFGLEHRFNISRIVQTSMAAAVIVDDSDKKLIAEKERQSDAQQYECESSIQQIHQLRQGLKGSTGIVDTTDVAKNINYDTNISTLNMPQVTDERLTTLYELIRSKNDKKRNVAEEEERTDEIGAFLALFDDIEDSSSAPSKKPEYNQALLSKQNNQQENPFRRIDEYGEGHEFYMRHEKLSINYKLFKEHYQSTKRITEYRASQSLKQPKTEEFEKIVPEGFGSELQKFIERHPEKDQKILIALVSEHDSGLLSDAFELKLNRNKYKNYLSEFLPTATTEYRNHKGFSYDFVRDDNQNQNYDDYQSERRSERDVGEEEDGNEGSINYSALFQSASEGENDDDNDDDAEDAPSINELNEEEKIPEEPQEENKKSSTEEEKRNVKKKELPIKTIDSSVRETCEEIINFSIIDDHFLVLLISQLYLNVNERSQVSNSLKKLCISPEIELKVISIILFALENHRSNPLAALLNKHPTKLGPEPDDKNTKLFAHLKTATSSKYFIPNDLLKAYGPEVIKKLVNNDVFGSNSEHSNLFTLLDRVVCLLQQKELTENTELHLNLLNYILEALRAKKFEIIPSKRMLSVEELLLRNETAICSHALRVLLEECASREQNYPTVKAIFDVLCNSGSKFIRKNLELMLGICLDKIIKFNTQLESGVPKLKQAPYLGQKIMLGLQITKGLKPLQEFLKSILSYLFLKIKGKVNIIEESKKEKSEKELKKEKRRAEYGKKVEPLIDEILNNQSVLEFIFNIFEILTQYAKFYSETSKEQYNHEHLQPMVSILCSFHGLYSLSKHIKTDPAAQIGEKETQKEDKSVDSLPELQAMPKLSRFVSKEGDAFGGLSVVSLNRSVSQIKRQTLTANIQEIFHECLYKIKDLTEIVFTNLSQVDRKENVFINFVKAFPYLTDLKSKEKLSRVRYYIRQNEEDWYEQYEMTVRRDALLEESMLQFKRKRALKCKLKIVYNGEEGYDAGGLKRGWFTDITKELFDPRFGLFKVSANKRSIQPSLLSAFFPNFEQYFEFAGAFVAKAIRENCAIDVYFNRCFIKHLLEKHLTLNDLEDLDPSLTKSLKWMLENDVEALMQDFTYEVDMFDSRVTKELKPDGANITVDESNKKEYVKLVALAKMRDEIAEQIRYFKHGFYQVLPLKDLALFSENDVNLLIAGEPEVDIDDMEKHSVVCEFSGNKSNQTVIWFWEVVKTFDAKGLAALLYFSSGSTRVPHGGYFDMPFQLICAGSDENMLPIAHTCSNCIELPEYKSKEKLEEKLLMAIFEGSEGYWIN